MCVDVTNLGRWGNGNVEVPLAAIKDIPYLMSLIRRSLEKQLEPAASCGTTASRRPAA